MLRVNGVLAGVAPVVSCTHSPRSRMPYHKPAERLPIMWKKWAWWHVLIITFLWHKEAISNRTSFLPLVRLGFGPRRPVYMHTLIKQNINQFRLRNISMQTRCHCDVLIVWSACLQCNILVTGLCVLLSISLHSGKLSLGWWKYLWLWEMETWATRQFRAHWNLCYFVH